MKNLLLIVIPVLLFSCSHKAWTKRGFKKGWIDTIKTRYTDTIYVDSNRVKEITDTFLLALWDTLEIQSPCDSLGRLTVKSKTIIRTMIEEKYLPAVMYPEKPMVFSNQYGDSAIVWGNKNGWYCDLRIQKSNYKCPDEWHWKEFIIGSIASIAFLLIIFRLLKK